MRKEEIFDHVKNHIINGKLQPGDRLVEARLCEDLGVGRGRVREAIKYMAHKDFVEIIPYKGALVKGLSQKDIAQIYDLIAVLEALAARLATLTICKEDLVKLENMIEAMEQCPQNQAEFFNLNLKFHAQLTELGGNERLSEIVTNLKEQTSTYRMGLLGFYNAEQLKASLSEHRKILTALKNRDAEEVENVIRKHFTDAKHRLIKYMNQTL